MAAAVFLLLVIHTEVPASTKTPPYIPIHTWFSLGPANISGRIQAIAFDPNDANTIYLGAAGGGVWKSVNGGQSWKPIGDALPSLCVSAIAVSPRDPRIVIIGTGDPVVGNDWNHGIGILRSIDGGATWLQTNIHEDSYSVRNGFHAIEFNSATNVVLAASVKGLFRSTDEGATWVQVEAVGNWTDVKWRPQSMDTAFAVRELGGLYLSSDGGQSFSHLTAGLPPDSSIGDVSKIGVSESNPDYLYSTLSSPEGLHVLGIYRSIDGGATWVGRAISPDGYTFLADYANVVIVDPGDANHVITGGYRLFESTDGGSTWTEIDSGRDGFHGIAYSPGTERSLWVTADLGVFEWAGGRLEDRNRGLVTLQAYDVCFSRNSRSLGYVGTQDRGILNYHGDSSWQSVFGDSGGSGTACNCDPLDPWHVYTEYPFGFHIVTHDGFTQYELIISGLEGQSRYLAPVDMDQSNPERLFTATSAGIFRTTNGGGFWERVGDAEDVVSISISPVTPNWIWALERSSGIVRRSNDGGSTWTPFQAAPFFPVGGTKIFADPRDSTIAFATFLNHPQGYPVVLRTGDGGSLWQDMSGMLQGQSVNTFAVDPSDPGHWFAGTKSGVWHYVGSNWQPFGRGLPRAVVMDIEVQDRTRKIRVATYGRGIWEADLKDSPPTETGNGSLLLERTSINPSPGGATIRYAGRGSLPLQLFIHDVAGRLVARLAEVPADGLVRTTRWEPGEAAAGVYFAVLRSGGAVLTKKIVLVR